MIHRCSNENHQSYHNYGGRGISVCEEWHNPKTFIEWALANGWRKGLFTDRKNNDGNYEPDNVRFVKKRVSDLNTRLLIRSNTTGYRGVRLEKRTGKYYAAIKINGKEKYLGTFQSIKLAALRYDAEAYLLNDGRPRNIL